MYPGRLINGTAVIVDQLVSDEMKHGGAAASNRCRGHLWKMDKNVHNRSGVPWYLRSSSLVQLLPGSPLPLEKWGL